MTPGMRRAPGVSRGPTNEHYAHDPFAPRMVHGARTEAERAAFVEGYVAAYRDIGGPHTGIRVNLIAPDVEAAAIRTLEEPGWLDELADDIAYAPTPSGGQRERRDPLDVRGTVYVFGDDDTDVIKIGWTRDDVEKRRRAVEKASGRSLSTLAVFATARRMECQLHERFAAARLPGEWFRLSDAELAWLTAEAPL